MPEDAAASLHQAFVLLRWAGPLPAPRPAELAWLAWLGGDEATREGLAVLEAQRLAASRRFDRLVPAKPPGRLALPEPVCAAGLVDWLLSARHPRALLRWCARVREAPPAAPTMVGVALAAFSFSPDEALQSWFLLRWRLGWQREAWPDPAAFLAASGPALPALCRRLAMAAAPVRRVSPG
jgi:hypothetical protein